jgi:two-component system phosphate regulon sensor histidine kinase PhoR
MRRTTINTVVIIGIFSILSILSIQLYWINETLESQQNAITIQDRQDSLNLKQFEEQVRVALRNVVEEISTHHADSSDLYGAVKQQRTNYFLVDINEDLHPYYLEQLLKRSFYDQGIINDFQYGIYDCYSDSIVYGNLIRYSRDSLYNPITDSVVGITSPQLTWKKDGHYFTVFFPEVAANPIETGVIMNSPWIYLIVIVGLVLIFFGYSISIILRQKKLSEVKTDFINNMTHELKTPISTIGLSSEMLLKEDFSNDPIRIQRYAGLIYKENKRLENQVEKVLNIAKLDQNEIILNKQVLQIHELIEEAAESFRFNQLEKGGTIDLKLDASSNEISGDLVHITNVIFNLLDNAVKYCNDFPVVEVSSTSSTKGVYIQVKDYGIGIKKENLKFVFDQFYRVPTGNLHNVKGFGLGLYYVKMIVEAHGGSINVKSIFGKETAFNLFFPFK